HPRRPPAHQSVSLLHSPRARVPTVDRSDSSSDGHIQRTQALGRPSRNTPSSLQPLGRESSGESSNAEQWFEKSNNDVRDSTAPFVDGEPPFFMRNSSSSETPPGLQDRMKRFLAGQDGSQSLPLRTGLLHIGTDGSSTEDFRGVIDDLTIENKKLKRRLKQYEKLHDSHLKDEKLFEVRFHSLPPQKKLELEDMLRKFTSGLTSKNTASFPPNGYEGLLPMLQPHKTASSQASMKHADSAYASMSASGQGGSSSLSASDSRQKAFKPSAASRRQNIHSYLHHIPEGLLPQPNPATMTERARKKLVVKRLEHLFAGKGAAAIGHQQAMQQQDVSHMAAYADRSALEAEGQHVRQEGTREANIMTEDAEDDKDETPDFAKPQQQLGARIAEQDFASLPGTEQRPTRPLDLDPHRAQVPMDNIRYMRHLGFSPPDPRSSASPEEGHGWIYLNVLVNMAQLHTINVTADFVRTALGELSDKFELSNDGRKVRWRGGREVTQSSSGSGAASIDAPSESGDGQSPHKRLKTSHKAGSRLKSRVKAQAQGAASSRSRAENNKLVYTPMFSHRDSSEESDESSSEEEDDDVLSPFPVAPAGDSSGMTSSGIRTTSTRPKKHKDDGPIIFYNNARFCTDLSGERRPEGNMNAPPYVKLAVPPLGKVQHLSGRPAEKRGPLALASELPEPMDLGDNPIPESMEVKFPTNTSLTSASAPERDPIELEVTGIGGVYPADNFAIRVESRHVRVDQSGAPQVSHAYLHKTVPPKLAKLLHGHGAVSKSHGAVHKQIVSARRRDLPPSRLPPALSFMPFEEDYVGDDTDADEELSLCPGSLDGLPPAAAPQIIDVPYASSNDEGEDEDDDSNDAESDGSLDLLALAREVDPEAVRACEREYDANMAERLAEEIPAGSSAATAGGGSGFASPSSGVGRDEYRRARHEVRAAAGMAKMAALRKAQTGDSM
ncbi:hypothetical protein BAUCODRAFT_56667, partial [Baudoinia panamericana UAMH 10762]